MKSLYLASIVLPAISTFSTSLSLGLIPSARRLGRMQKTNRLRPLILQPRQTEAMIFTEKPKAKNIAAFRARLTAWRETIDQKMESFNRPAISAKISALRGDPNVCTHRQYQKEMARRSTEVWLETGQARPSSGRFDRMFSLIAPHPRVSIIQPENRYEMSVIAEVDPDQTPRLRPMNALPADTQANPAQFGLDDDVFSDYSILNNPARASLDEYPTSPNRTDLTHSRAGSMSSSPGARSVKLASVHQAVRGRMSLGPTFLIGGSQGDAIITARRSMDLDTALRAELGGHEIMHSRQQSFGRPGILIASRASEDQSQFQESNRRSGEILGRAPHDTPKEERRRTFDFGKMLSGWRKTSDLTDSEDVCDFDGVHPERLKAIMSSQ